MTDSLNFAFDQTPDNGGWQPVLDHITWLRMPLPFSLNHINLWLVRDGDGMAAVDTGMWTPDAIDFWQKVNRDLLDGRGLSRVLVTHMHPDHVGMAGWLCKEFDCRLWMPRNEYFLCRILAADTGKSAPTDGVTFYRAAGLGDAQIERYKRMFGLFGKAVFYLPDSYVRLQEGQKVSIGDASFEVVMGNGHSPEHACLYDAEHNVVISGDQILPSISSNVSVWPTEPLANPLQDWLDSCRRLSQRFPEDVLVLPAHGRPFRNVGLRLQQLIDEHEEGLSKVLDLCAQPRRTVDLFDALFKSKINEGNLIMATGEAVANVNYLLARNELCVARQQDGVTWYQRT